MILSASRRTDIPAYYSDWFFQRIKEGFFLVRNPMNINQVSKIKITPELVDCIVFWTKNPEPMLDRLSELKNYHYYFQFTLTSYGKDIETNLPSKGKKIIETFKKLSTAIGKEKIIWRYDPILFTDKYSLDYHVYYFEKIAEKIHDYTEKCTISFIDFYRNTKSNMQALNLRVINQDEKQKLSIELLKIADKYQLNLATCAENINLGNCHIEKASCIDDRLIEKIIGYKLDARKDKNQRLECGCIESIDIGTYNTCMNGCKYCYANHNKKTVVDNFAGYDKKSPLLCGAIKENDIVKERLVKSCKQKKFDLF